MKRSIIVLVVAGAMLLALPATAKKPSKPDPDPPSPVTCVFGSTGVLLSEDRDVVALGEETTNYRCDLTAESSDSFTFVIEPTDGATVLFHPAVQIKDAISGDLCFYDGDVGRAKISNGIFAVFKMTGDLSDSNFACSEYEGDDYVLTFLTGNAKGGTVQLTMTPAPMQGG